MIIAAKNIRSYRKTLQFPIQILAETGPVVAMTVYEKDLQTLIEMQAIIGVGSWKRIKHFRLSRPLAESVQLRLDAGRQTPPIASTYKSDGPTLMMKRAIGMRQAFTLRKWAEI